MFILKSEIGFDASHYLGDYDGKCANIHGHRYRLIIKVKGEKLQDVGPKRGMVEDFNDIKLALKEIHDLFDHKLMIEDDEIGQDLIRRLKDSPQKFEYILLPYRPTAEEMARDIYNKIKQKGINIDEVELYETPTNSCIYREG